KDPDASLYETLSLLEVPAEALNAVDVTFVGPGVSSLLGNALFTIVPLLILGWFAFSMLRSMRGSQDQAMSFRRPRAKAVSIDQPVVTVGDVAGMEWSKHEVAEILDVVNEPQKFIRLGPRVPKRVLMIGPPGTGKTLLARAI